MSNMKPALVFVWSCDLNPAPCQIKPLQLGHHAYENKNIFHFCRAVHLNMDQMSEFSFENETDLFVPQYLSD